MAHRALPALLVTLVLVAGCSGSGSSTGSSAPGSAAIGSAALGMPPPSAAASGPPSLVPLVQARPGFDVRDLIRTAEVTLRVDDVDRATDAAIDASRAAGGGLVEARTDGGETREATLTLKVPTERFDALLADVNRLGRELDRTVSVVDATEQVADVASRLASQQASVARVRALLERATSVADVVTIEGELARREAELESLQARQRALEGQTALATVTVHVLGPSAPAPPPADRSGGFTGGLSAGYHALLRALAVALTVLGALLPFGLVAGAVTLPILALRRRRHPSPATGSR